MPHIGQDGVVDVLKPKVDVSVLNFHMDGKPLLENAVMRLADARGLTSNLPSLWCIDCGIRSEVTFAMSVVKVDRFKLGVTRCRIQTVLSVVQTHHLEQVFGAKSS